MLNIRKNLLILALLLALGLIMVLVMKMKVSIETGTIIAALLFPFLSYAVLSSAIEELGFGVVKAKFSHAAGSTIHLPELVSMHPGSTDFDQVGQAGAAALEQMLIKYKYNGSYINQRPAGRTAKQGRKIP